MLLFVIPLVLIAAMPANLEPKVKLYPDLTKYLDERRAEFSQIPPERQAVLRELAGHVRATRARGKPVRLTFICTHNSRRSHMSQVWARVAAEAYGVADVSTYSGGTEVTAFNPRAVAALRRAGLRIEQTTHDENPIYHVRYADTAPPLTCFSKVHTQAPNPRDEVTAVMTCSQADAACPTVPGATARFAIPYEDPKVSDGQPQEAQVYDERCAQIAREFLFVFSQIAAAEGT